ncbi:omega-6 fatty acid desaturase (delta-12 desaturase) [Draconibacterium orientale]|uniref:Omega-6 fatty acid desaturase (Delta-12 desaturase) n=2 Tax=Draconibacterium orientale TaxID=1168034 RepID=A0A1I0E4S0_9BACT|nr:fatty acid desaturase [Draconibacterium orientale]SET40135.1 omega-6 fatty acid desaturase (delta-12 desaturase) [Draconibacterium orientale]
MESRSMNTRQKETSPTSPWQNFIKNSASYQKPDTLKSVWQIVNTFIPYVGVWILLVYSLSVSLWLTAFLLIIAAGLLVRLFIIFHDCGHGSFFKSYKANRYIGMLFGILAFTPFDKWHSLHGKHHATVGNLDKRGDGDVWTMTKEEYLASSKKRRLYYRIYRNPVVMFGIGSLYVFLLQNRLTKDWMTQKQKNNVYVTNIALVILFAVMSVAIGFFTYLILQLIILYLAGMAGLWLFYLQHQYEDVSWVRSDDWNYTKLALEGSSFVKFPKLLQWFSGNIGYHHIHHINARIPNYNLPKCYAENKIFREVKPVTFRSSLKTLRLRLWDEKLQKLIGFQDI